MKTNQKKEFLGLKEINEMEKNEITGGQLGLMSIFEPGPIVYCCIDIPPPGLPGDRGIPGDWIVDWM